MNREVITTVTDTAKSLRDSEAAKWTRTLALVGLVAGYVIQDRANARKHEETMEQLRQQKDFQYYQFGTNYVNSVEKGRK